MATMKDVQQPVWGGEQVLLKDLLMKHDVPTVARVVKGQFMNIGTAKFSPLKKLHQDVMVHSIKTGLKILGHSMVRMDGRDGRTRLVPLEQRLSIPSTYKGWFELLSENGRSARPLETVQDLAKLFPTVNHVLVRQNVKAYLGNETGGKMTFDTTRVILSGEQLKVIGTFSITQPNVEGKVMLLKCSDVNGVSLFLSFDQKGYFTPIASADDITGVFMIKDVLSRFRLPLTVKLVQGVWPKVDSHRFSGIIRLDWAYTDETAFVSPLDRSAPRIYPIPTAVNLRLVVAANNSELKAAEAYSNIIVKCNRLVTNYHNTIHLIISVPEGAVKAINHAQANIYSETNSSSIPPPRPLSQTKKTRSREDILMDELDDLYGYLREGRHPPMEKFIRQRDSDEETYYEEPEFEPMSKFKSRLAMLDKGDVKGSQKNTGYNFIDPRVQFDSNHNRVGTPGKKPSTPPELPPRHYKRAESLPVIDYSPTPNGTTVVTVRQGTPEGPKPLIERHTSKETLSKQSRQSKGSGSSAEKRGSTDSKENRSSKSGSSKVLPSRKSMPLIYL